MRRYKNNVLSQTLYIHGIMELPIKTTRITSIDLLRGIVIIIMALDHVRDYFHAGVFLYDPADISKTNAPVFFTRWITHFCAPVFVLLAGTSAYLTGERKTKKELSSFLLKRGLWLMLLELTVIAFAWNFNFAFPFVRLQVIWVLGLCMVLLAGIIYLPPKLILAMGLMILFGHNLLDNIHATGVGFTDFLWAELHERKRFSIGGHTFSTGYPVLPWLGIMLLGYSLGKLYHNTVAAAARKKYLLIFGAAAILLFVLLRGINYYGDSATWAPQKSVLLTICSFLNVTKYPPSLLYALMTLGPALIVLALIEKPLNRFGEIVITYGRVPMFFYLLHIFVIHGLATIAVVLSGRPFADMVITGNLNGKDTPWLVGYGFPLWFVYLVWLFVVIAFYPLCKWYDNYKTSHREKWWLSYL
jgi:uncharacterized membrane protein